MRHLVILYICIAIYAEASILLGSPPYFSDNNTYEVFKVNENDPISLECLAVDADKIAWKKNGIDTGVRSKLFFIEKASRDDSGEYRCWASNSMGSVLSDGYMVNVNYLDDFDESSTSYEVLANIGSHFVLFRPDLMASPSLDVEYLWYKDDEKITSNQTHYITERGDLVVVDVIDQYFGSYKLIASSESFGEVISKDYYALVNDSKIEDPSFSILVAPEDRNLSLDSTKEDSIFDCVPSISADYKISWFIDGIPLNSDRVGVQLKSSNRQLVIDSSGLSLFSQGRHTLQCKAVSDSGRSFDERTSTIEILKPPKIRASPYNITKAVGDTLTLKCNVQGSSVRWFFNGNEIKTSKQTLSISALTSSHFGIYQCEARNFAGVDVQTRWLREGTAAVSRDETPQERSLTDNTESEPNFIEEPQSVSLDVKTDQYLMKCSASGNPPPTIVWKFDGEIIPSSTDKYEQTDEGLLIHNIRRSEDGKYTCVARNSHGTKSKSAMLSVIGNSLIEVFPTNQSLLIGTNIDIPCDVFSNIRDQTKIKWFLNGEELSAKGNTGLRISFKRGKLHIGQVGPDSIGEYRCLATYKDKEDSSSMWLEIIEKPGMPSSINVALVNDTLPAKIRVNWNEGFDGNSPIIRYIIQMRTLGPTDLWSDWETVGETDPSENCCSYLMDNLKPSVTAEFRVIASNKHGSGKPSLPSANVTMPQQPPAAAPRTVAASARSSNSIIVQWQKPQEELFSGDIMGYMIRYRLAGYTLPWIEKNVTTQDARNAIIDQLITWQEYEIQVAAYNERGLGVFSKSIFVTTAEGVPTQAPKKIEIKVINSTSVQIGFVSPDQQRIPGVNLGYKIQFWKGVPEHNNLYKTVLADPVSRELSLVVDGLEKFGHYNVTILCYTSVGDGPKTASFEVVTFEDIPEKVSSLTVEEVMFDGAFITWEPPIRSNGIIRRYVIRYWNDASSEAKTTMELSGDQHNATFSGLQSTTKYSFDIFASTSIGDGPREESKFESGRPPVLPERPMSLSVTDIQARSAKLQFTPGHDGYTSIRKWIVEARVADSGVFHIIFNISLPRATSFVVKGLRPFTQYQLRLIAENVKGRGAPSEPSRPFETLQTNPDTPSSTLFAEPVSATSLSLSWTPLLANQWNGQPKGYLVLYRIEGSDDWKEVRTSSLRASEFTLSDLSPFTTYEVDLFAENMFGRSASTGLTSTRTYESAPSGYPQHVKASLVSPKTVEIKWDPVADESANGDILGYTVRAVPKTEWLGPEDTITVPVVGVDTLETTISALRAFTRYDIFVSAFTIVGNGPQNVRPTEVMTEEDIPGTPSGVAFSLTSETEVRLKWTPPEQPNGKIKAYIITYWPKAEGQSGANRIPIPAAKLGAFSATDLKSNTMYTFTIAAENSVGVGPESIVDVFTSSIRLPIRNPPVPVKDERSGFSSTQIALSWDNPNPTDGSSEETPVRFVHIEYQRANDDTWTSYERIVSGDKTGASVNRLSPNTAYRFRIRFAGDFSVSVWSSESEWMRTLPASPVSPPSKIHSSPYDSNSLQLQWTNPEKSTWNADAIGFHVSYKEYPSNDSWKMEEIAAKSERPEKEYFILPKLASFHHYIVRMSSFNSEGDSVFSTPVFVYVGYSIPKRNVTNLVAEPQSSSSIAVRWNAWAADESDVISGFKIRFVPLTSVLSESSHDEELMVVENSSCLLSDLRKYTDYQIAVVPYNRAGEGTMQVTRVRTLEDVPGPVSNLHFADTLLDSTKVIWDKPTQPNGVVLRYIVNYRTFALTNDYKNEAQMTTEDQFLSVSNLREGAQYLFVVWAETAAGKGTESTANVTIGSNPDGPKSPIHPTIVPGQSSVTLSWTDVPIRSLTGHLIQAKRVSVNLQSDEKNPSSRRTRDTSSSPGHVIGEWITLKVIDGTSSKYEINYRDLEPSSNYVFRIFARNEKGLGFPSVESEELVVPASIPDDPFFTSWWFISLVAMSTFVVIVVVVAFLCVTGSEARFKREKRNSVDSLQLADGNFVTFQMKGQRNIDRSRNDLMIRPGTTQSWISDRDPPGYGSVLNVERDNAGGSVVNMYGLATDVIPTPPNHQAMQRLSALVGRDVSGTGRAYVSQTRASLDIPGSEYGGVRSEYGNRSEYGFVPPNNHHRHNDEFGDADSFDDEDESVHDSNVVDGPVADIASHYGQIDHYRDTWRRVRDTEVVRGSALPGGDSSTVADSPAASSENTWPSQPAPALANGFSSFV